MKTCAFTVHDSDSTYSHFALTFAVQLDFQLDPDKLRQELLHRKNCQSTVNVEAISATQFKVTVSFREEAMQEVYEYFFNLIREIEDEIDRAKHDQHMLGLLAA